MAKEIKSAQFHLPAAQQQQQEGASSKKKVAGLHQLRAENGTAVGGREIRRSPVDRGAEDINECAEDFINRFRQNLQLQRLQSIENYREMLARGL